MRPGVVTFVGSGWGLRKKEVDAMGHTVESGCKAQLGLGITMPYISPPLIRSRESDMNQRGANVQYYDTQAQVGLGS